jgi:monoamine oxidase
LKDKRIIIVGGGLSGLTLAYLLSKENIVATILEASPRIGGRIETIKGTLQTPLELGATWFSDIHSNLIALIEKLGIQKYTQFSRGKCIFQTKSFEPPQEFVVPESEQPSYRVVGGTQAIIQALHQKLPATSIYLNSKISKVSKVENELKLETINGQTFYADTVILCLPPQLVASQIQFSPSLPAYVNEILPEVHTWMAGSVKFVLEYSKAFWRDKNYSGMLYSHAGIVTEMYDHTNFEENKYGFTGFLNGNAAFYSQKERKEFVLKQLVELFGNDMLSPTTYEDKIWSDEFILAGKPAILRPHQNNGHPIFKESYLGEKLFFCGTETSPECSGYMEGAIISAKNIFQIIIEK